MNFPAGLRGALGDRSADGRERCLGRRQGPRPSIWLASCSPIVGPTTVRHPRFAQRRALGNDADIASGSSRSPAMALCDFFGRARRWHFKQGEISPASEAASRQAWARATSSIPLRQRKESCNGLSGSLGVRHQDGGCGRVQDLHVYPGHGDPRLHGRRDPCAGRGICRHGDRSDRLSDHRRHPVPCRLLDAVPAGLRPADGRLRADAARPDRQAAGRHVRRRDEELGACVRRQFPGRLDGSPDDGDRRHVRLLIAARQGRDDAGRNRRGAHAWATRPMARRAC